MNPEKYSFKYGYETRKFPPHELLIQIEELKEIITEQKKEIEYFKKSQAFEKFSMVQFRMVKSKITALEKEKLALTKQNFTLENRLKALDYKSERLSKIELEKIKLKEKLDEQRSEIMKFTQRLSENSDLDILSEVDKLQEKISPTAQFRKFIKNKSLLTNKFREIGKNDTSKPEANGRFLTKLLKRSSVISKKNLTDDERNFIPSKPKNSKSDLSVHVEYNQSSGLENVHTSKKSNDSNNKLTVQTIINNTNNVMLKSLEANERKVTDSLKEKNNLSKTNANVTDIQYEVPVLKNSSSIFEIIQCKNGGPDAEKIIGSFKIINYCKNSNDVSDVKLRAHSSSSTFEKSKEQLIKISSKYSSLDSVSPASPFNVTNLPGKENNIQREFKGNIQKNKNEIITEINGILLSKLQTENKLDTEISQITNQSEVTSESEILNQNLEIAESAITNQSKITNQTQIVNNSQISTGSNVNDDTSNESLDSINTNFATKDTEEYLKSLEDIQKIPPISSYDGILDSMTEESSTYSNPPINKKNISMPPLLSSSNFHVNQMDNSFDKLLTNPSNVESVFKVSLRRLEAALKRNR